MNKIIFPLKPQMKGAKVADLQDALQLLLDLGIILSGDESARRKLTNRFKQERERQYFGNMTAKAVSIFQREQRLQPNGVVDESTAKALNKLLEELESNENRQREKRVFLFKPEVFFTSPSSLHGLNTEQEEFINSKLNDQFRKEILNTIGITSEALNKRVNKALETIDYQKIKNSNLSDVIIENILNEIITDDNLYEEAAEVEARLSGVASEKVSDLLRLDIPLNENSIFDADIHRVKNIEYARLSQLDNKAEKKLVEKNLFLGNADETMLAELVEEGIISDQQKANLQLTIELGKLTGDNISFISAIKSMNPKSAADFIGWEKADWLQMITDKKLPLPPRETAETYAENILLNIEFTYPSQFLFSRLLKPEKMNQFNLLDSLNSLLQNNDKLIDGEISAEINLGDVDDETRNRLQSDLQNLMSFANSYRYLGITDMINDKNLNLDNKKSAISARLQLLDTFYKNNPELDLRLVNFFDKKDGTLNWSNISATDQPFIKKQLMAYQRVLNLADETADRQILLNKGFDSGMAVVGKTEAEFVRTSGMSLGKARMTYTKAQEETLLATHNYQAIHDVIKGNFKDLAVANIDWNPGIIYDLREITGFDDLFGSQNYCDCEECRSILSPAAYFVDLMYFIEREVSKSVFVNAKKTNHPLYLKNRRGDLWKLQLTCENTHTLIPYLTIVNEVLENYVETVVSGDIFEKLSDPNEKISFCLPFNLPLEEMRLYLSHFGITLHNVFQILKQSETKIWRMKLNLSKEDLEIIITPDLTGVKFRFGNPASFTNIDVQDFIRLAGIIRWQLDDLLGMTFNPDLQNIKVGKKSLPDELQNFPEILKNLTNSRLDFIHRFIRLWKKTLWSIPDLDMVLTSLKDAGLIGSELDQDTVLYVARLVDIQEKLKLKIEELCAMVYQLPVSEEFPKPPAKQADKRLYERLFDLKNLFGEKNPDTHEINTSVTFHHYSLNTVNPNDKEIDSRTPQILGGIGISETELLLLFDLLKNEMPFDANGDATLDRWRISLLYRHARISRALKLNIEDFIQSLSLNFNPANLVITELEQIHYLNEFRNWLKSSPFTVSELRFILKGEESNTVKYKTNPEMVGTLVQEIQASQETDKLSVLKALLAKSFNLISKQLDDTLNWVSIDINSAGIQTALNVAFTNGVPDNPTDLNTLLDLVKQIERALLVFSNLKFKEETIAYLTQKHAVLSIASLKNLTLDNIKALTVYRRLIILDEEAESTVQPVLDSYLSANTFSSDDAVRMADLWKRDKSLIESLINSLTPPVVPIEALEYLWECLSICHTLGINGYSLQKLADDTDFNKLKAARDVALGSFSSKYDDEKIRQEKLDPYQDKINVIKRDALCDYIIARQKDLKFKDLHDIYAFFLLDVEMSGCFRTSRVVCAISSLQLYVHRCLVNLEQSDPKLNPNIPDVKVDPSLIPADQWEWRKNYRVWEANRKVFLYPENYILPDLRDNKTPIFKELEEELLQEKITIESAEAAYKKYVSQFAELAHLQIAGSYYHKETDTYYFFGRTQQDPPQYYYRKWIENKVWTPWEKIELGINCPVVSAAMHLGKLYLFWVESQVKEKTKVSGGDAKLEYYEVKIDLVYSYLNEKGRWISAQRIEWLYPSETETISAVNKVFGENDLLEMELSKTYRKVYPMVVGDSIHMSYYNQELNQNVYFERHLDLFHNRLRYGSVPNLPASDAVVLSASKNSARLAIKSKDFNTEHYFDRILESPGTSSLTYITDEFPYKSYKVNEVGRDYVMHVVHSKYPESVLTFNAQQFLVQQLDLTDYGWFLRRLVRLTTSLSDALGAKLFSEGLESFLALDTQGLTETPFGIKIKNIFQLLYPFENTNHIDFRGSYGVYYRELFFDIPFLIANHCNACQKFKEAKWWYERIFDPTASESPEDKKENDRVWRYIEFRDVTMPKMKDILTDEEAIEQYNKDPFNPHAIARLRMSAYQKAIVMKYIDNLLDWGDYLFAHDTMESINEATMLYVLAFDILGKRPAKLGKCETAKDKDLTYEKIGPAIDKGSEFLITLENWSRSNITAKKANKYQAAKASNSKLFAADNTLTEVELETSIHSAETAITNGMGLDNVKPRYEVTAYTELIKSKARYSESVRKLEKVKSTRKQPGIAQAKQSILVFCIPPNYDLLKYWDRVENRLFKIRHCMNISGIRRQLALFQPPIDPMALVRARAAGLSLEEILGMMVAPLPPYRFSYLIEKAKQFTQTVQSFGNALLNALEKKDVEELTLLRSVHERNILRMTKEIKKQQVMEAQRQYLSMIETKTNVQNRINYYQSLIDEGLTGWEITQQVSRHIATGLKTAESVVHLQAAISYLIPQIGSPFAMKYGGKELGDSGVEFAQWTSSMAAILDAVSTSAGLEATFQRREQEWQQQLLLAQQELKQLDLQVLAAEARQLIAEKDLETHEKNMEQADEIHEFYKNKFTALGLYNHLSTTLNRLYREAYNMAYDLALMAERTYQFERDDNIIFVASDNWQFDRAGLLAGERLLLQLQRMEKAYIEQHKRDYEVTQSVSLALLDPTALLTLKQTGSCEFSIPEITFDLFYPGQYKRLIKSVRITIPCVTGPYTNISSKLTLQESKIRKEPTTDPSALLDIPTQKLTSIATSNAQNDGGVFELNFRDERYLPFEGAGAISKWRLELPSKLRSFSYDTISDIIIHISYTAKDDGVFRTTVENQIVDTLSEFAADSGLYRLLSLKHEFPSAFHKLLQPSGTIQTTEFELTKQHFPYFLANKDLNISEVKVYLKPKGEDPVSTTGLTLKINNTMASGWSDFDNLKEATVAVSNNPIKKWTVDAATGGLDKEELDDILILLKYIIT